MRKSLAIVAIIIIIPLITGVGASIFSGETDTITQNVSLEPADGPNGEYANLNENDELVIDITESESGGEGVPIGDVTTINNVFVAGYNGSQYAEIWITEDSPAVKFVSGGQQIQSQSNAVRVGSNETVSVGMQIDTTERTSIEINDMTVHARVAEPSDISNTTAQSSDSTSTDGEPDESETSIQTQSPTADSQKVTIQNAEEESVTVDTDSMVVDTNEDATIALESVSASVETTQATMTIEDVSAPETTRGDQNIDPVGVVDITETGIISQASLRFSVSQSYLESTGATADEVVVLHETEDGWTQLDTDVVKTRDSDDLAVIEADTNSFSMFAVAVERPQITITDVTVSSSAIDESGVRPVTIDVQNNGDTDSRTAINLRDTESQIATQTVTLAPDSSSTLQFNLSSDTVKSSNSAIKRIGDTTVVFNSNAETVQTTEPTSTVTTDPVPSEVRDSDNKTRATDPDDKDTTVDYNEELNTVSTETNVNQSVSTGIKLDNTMKNLAGATLVIIFIITVMWSRR